MLSQFGANNLLTSLFNDFSLYVNIDNHGPLNSNKLGVYAYFSVIIFYILIFTFVYFCI